MPLQELDLALSCLHVSILIAWNHLSANPHPNDVLSDYYEHTARIEDLTRRLVAIQILKKELSDDSTRILDLMRYHAEHTWTYWQTVEIRVIQALIEPVELGDESQIGICTLSSLLHPLIAFIEAYSFREYHVGDADSG